MFKSTEKPYYYGIGVYLILIYMNREQAIKVLREQDKKGKYIFSNKDLHKFFPEDSFKTFNEGLKRLVKSGILKRVCRNVYINEEAKQFDSHTKRSVKGILESTCKVNERPLRMALKKTALRDLKRVGRNINLINSEELA